ncbi:MAG: class I SAM-dependent methyltransferase [Spirochaetes bacterium]|nr:class I SAM-dependent methyltransferase [Spirochaetota bacterium]
MMPEWYFDEFTQVGTDYTDLVTVEAYDAKMSTFRDYGRESELIMRALGAGPEHDLLEIGTGTGHFAVAASRVCRRVVAADVSETMLRYARSMAEKEGRGNIRWVHRGFLSFDIPDDPFDFIVTGAALHHLPDLWKAVALKRIHDALAEGGRLFLGDVIFSCPVAELDARVATWTGGYRERDETFYRESITHLREEFSTYDWIIEGMLERAGFAFRKLVDENSYMAYLCIKK